MYCGGDTLAAGGLASVTLNATIPNAMTLQIIH